MDTSHPNYGLTITKEEGSTNHNALNPLPRAVLRPNSYILLDGEWKFSLDMDDKGLLDSWYVVHEYEGTAQWPGTVEEHMAVAKHLQPEKRTWYDKVVVWYEREFPLPARAETGEPNSILQLSFGACGYETMVWLNGIALKTIEGEEVHRGEYTSFSYELQEDCLRPNNRITVRVADTMDADIPRGKQESHVYKRGGIWYQTNTGAVRSIWLETVERNRLRSRVGVFSIVEDNLVRFNVTTRIHDPGIYKLKLFIYNYRQRDQQPIATDEFTLRLEAGEKRQRVVVEVPGAKLWSPSNPQLYTLVAQLVDADGYAAEIETHFGLRKIEARGSLIYLNNQSLYLDGILYQPGNASYDQIRQHILAMKELGCNMVRIHIAGVDPRIYNLADEIGVLLWVEVPSPHRSSQKSRQAHKEELLRMVALMGTHPSVVIWSLYNEDWGAQDIATNPETRQYITDLYHYMQLAASAVPGGR
jgi:beta-galactosidase/beta-glucuronidase